MPWESKRWVVLKKLLQTINILRGFDIVHHRQDYAPDRVAQRNGLSKVPAVNTNRVLYVGFDIDNMFDGVGRPVLAGSYGDFVKVAQTTNHQDLSMLNIDLVVKVIHDLMIKFQ